MKRQMTNRFPVLRVTVLIAVLVAFAALVPAWAGESGPTDTVLKPSSAERVSAYFQAARQDFLNRELKVSASEIRAAASLLGEVQAGSEGTAWESLATARGGLDKLAGDIEQGKVRGVGDLDLMFAVAERALGGYYEERASQSRTVGNMPALALYLKAAAIHLENAFKALITPIDNETAKAIKEAKEFEEKLAAGWAGADAERVGQALRAGLERAARKIEEQHAPGSFSIKRAPKPAGSVDVATAVINVAKQHISSVVYIEVTESRMVGNPFLPFENDPFFGRFFGIPKMPRKFRQETKGLGSGIIIDAQGYILTNNHVAGGAAKMEVTLADGSRQPAKLVGADPKTDLAVIKISAPEPLSPAVFGDSDKIQVGDWVIAIGAPRAFEKSVTQGIVSAKHRTGITEPTGYQDFIQTDAAMNPGNSGGPLLNLYGQVVGINAAIASSSGGSEGIGFTIPSNMAVYVAGALIAHGKVERGWLGVVTQDLTPDLAKAARLDTLKGALVRDVVPGGPAERAGIKKDDVVTRYNGKEVIDSSALRNAVAETPPGQTRTITVVRNGKPEDLTVTIASEEEAAKPMADLLKNRLGVDVRLPTSGEADKYGLGRGAGAAVTRIDPNGPAGQAGLEKGDIILSINNRPVSGPDGLAGAVSIMKHGERAAIRVVDHRTGTEGTIAVTVK